MTDQDKVKKLVFLMAEYADKMSAISMAQKVALDDLRDGLSSVDPAADELLAPDIQ